MSMPRAELSPAPEFREISRIREFSENSTEFLCYFQNWSKTPQKASKCYRNVEKAPEIAQNFYIFVKSTPKSSRILERFQSGDSSAVSDKHLLSMVTWTSLVTDTKITMTCHPCQDAFGLCYQSTAVMCVLRRIKPVWLLFVCWSRQKEQGWKKYKK